MEPKRHGTLAGWREHKRLGTAVCDSCRSKREEYDVGIRSAPDRVRIARLKAQAQRQALVELRQNHEVEWMELYEKHKVQVLEDEKHTLPPHRWVLAKDVTVCTRCGRERVGAKLVRVGTWGKCSP